MKLYFRLMLVVLIVFAACKNSKQPTSTPVHNESSVQKDDSTSRFLVSFYSIGMGSEGDQIDKLKIYVTDFGQKVSKQIEYTEVPWGREGEVNFCFPLKELSPEQQVEFINGARILLKTAQWVHISENTVCRKR